MAESRTRKALLLLTTESKARLKVELYDAAQWPDAEGSEPGLLRLRVNGRWACNGSKYTFFDLSGLAAYLAREFGAVLGLEAPREAPVLPRGTRVRMPTARIGDKTFFTATWTAGDPYQLATGQWLVKCIGARDPVPVHDLEVIHEQAD